MMAEVELKPGRLLRDCKKAAHRVAVERLRTAKEKMGAARQAYDEAAAEWFAALLECEQYEEQRKR